MALYGPMAIEVKLHCPLFSAFLKSTFLSELDVTIKKKINVALN